MRDSRFSEKKKKKKKKKSTFGMVFPPLQEATSFVVRPQFFRPYEPLLQAASPQPFAWSSDTDGLVS